jgi:hypothetical protein
METVRLFPLARESEIRVVLRVDLEGEAFPLVHIFREPTAADKKAYWGRMSRNEIAGAQAPEERALDCLGAADLLYERCILRVEGYGLPEDSQTDGRGDGWKELIPLEHKLWAVNRLLSRAGTLSEETVKN